MLSTTRLYSRSLSSIIKKPNRITSIPHRTFSKMSAETMNTALITTWGEPPRYTQVPKPASTPEKPILIKVLGTGLHNVVRSRASGAHYSSGTLPHTPGFDGVGLRTSDNKPVYFFTFPSGGSFQDYVTVEERKVVEIPEGVEPLQVAAYANPVLSSWMALTARCERLPEGFTVLIMGATSASGVVAIDVARALGAGKIIAMARNAEALATLTADESIVLDGEDVTATDCSSAAEADVILDYLYGPVAEHLLSTTKFKKPVQYVHIGSLAGLDMTLPGHVLRSQPLTIRGSGPGSFANTDLAKNVPNMIAAFTKIKPRKLRVEKLSEVEKCWNEKGDRLVFAP